MNDGFEQGAVTPKTTPAQFFRDMADKIEKNAHEDFGGAFIVVPASGEPISGMLVGDTDINTFFILLKTKLDAAIQALDDAQRQGYGARR